MTAHPAALVLADHALDRVRPADSPVVRGACLCGWTGPVCDHPNHQADMLAEAGLLLDPRCGISLSSSDRRCELDVGHSGKHAQDNYRWTNNEAG